MVVGCFLVMRDAYHHWLFTQGEFNVFGAGLTLDVAAPVELALAPLLDFGLHRRVAATAAHLGAAPGVRGPKSFNFMLELRRRHSNWDGTQYSKMLRSRYTLRLVGRPSRVSPWSRWSHFDDSSLDSSARTPNRWPWGCSCSSASPSGGPSL